MQTISVQVQDSYLSSFIDYVKREPNLEIGDPNLKIDPYFYERKQDIQQIIDDIDNGSMQMLSEEESQKEIDLLFETLENAD
jgi:hypothetical protein